MIILHDNEQCPKCGSHDTYNDKITEIITDTMHTVKYSIVCEMCKRSTRKQKQEII